MPNVMNRPASPGHVRSAGRPASDGETVSTTSVTGPDFSGRGNAPPILDSSGSLRRRPIAPRGTSVRAIPAMRSPISAKSPVSSAMCMRLSEPNALPRTGMSDPSTFSKSTAGPPAYMTRRSTSAISRSGLAGSETLASSPAPSSASISPPMSSSGTPRRRGVLL